MRLTIFAGCLFILIPVAGSAQPPPALSVQPPSPQNSALEAFGRLEGAWAITSRDRTLPIRMTYQRASNGTIVTEQFGLELSVFAMNGPTLTLTHYCNVGNQPRLRLRPQPNPQTYDFELVEVVNLQPAKPDHVERMVYRFVDDRTIELQIHWFHPEGGEIERYTLQRVR